MGFNIDVAKRTKKIRKKYTCQNFFVELRNADIAFPLRTTYCSCLSIVTKWTTSYNSHFNAFQHLYRKKTLFDTVLVFDT